MTFLLKKADYLSIFNKRKEQYNELDSLWSRAVRRKFNRCVICNKGNCDAHHLVSRKNLQIRWNVRNGITLCRECHTKYHSVADFKQKVYKQFAKRISEMEDILIEKKSLGLWNDYLFKKLKTSLTKSSED